MSFPVIIELFGFKLHPHVLFELLGYSIGFQLYLRTRTRWQYRPLSRSHNLWLIAACIVGALVGSKILSWLDAPSTYWAHRYDIEYILGGKTIVGGLLGGWIGVEIAKIRLGIREATGDAFVFPLIAGLVIGRIGCFLSGLDDSTFGVATALPWGIDFGDGIARHPTQLYEIAFLLATALLLAGRMRRRYVNGYLFRVFTAMYLAFRLVVDFFKPGEHAYFGMNGIQVASAIGMLICIASLLRMRRRLTTSRQSNTWQIDPTSSTS